MVRNGILPENGDGPIVINSEQGHEIERPSSIRSVVSVNDGGITRLQVGGVATKFIEGELHLPDLPQ